MKIYTKTGDRGETGLWGGSRVRKDHPRLRAYGTIDELNCALGAALAILPHSAADAQPQLMRIQEELFIAGSILAGYEKAQVSPDAAARLEREIDEMTAALPQMDKFIMPGGSPAGAALHVARAVCRRAEREVVSLGNAPEGVIVYLNRLSDHLFTASRWVNSRAGCPETVWAGLVKR